MLVYKRAGQAILRIAILGKDDSMKILVTGATGFIGSHLTERLAKDGHNVSALVRGSVENSHKESLGMIKGMKVSIHQGDLLDKESLCRAVKGNDVVFHLAAIARPMKIADSAYFRVNADGTKNLLDACRKAGVKKIIHMSSVSAVGPARGGKPVNEKSRTLPIDTYGKSKLAAEKLILKYIRDYKMSVVILRPPMVFGPRDLELLKLFRMIKKRLFPIRHGEGYIEFLYVENLVEACVLAMKKGKSGEIYHINNGRSYRIKEVVDAIAEAEGVRLLPIKFPNFTFVAAGALAELLGKIFRFHPPFSKNTVIWMTKSFWYSDSSKAQKELGYRPRIGLDEGVRRTVSYYSKKNML